MRQSIEATSVAYTTAELEALNLAFRAMLERLESSIAMELQAHMRALQSQMNPHFLFNMLSVIVESCEERGVEGIVSMCLKLSSMLRYIADFGGDSATLAEEAEHTRNYLDLMSSRYEDKFSYEIVAEGPIEEARVPRVIMQPLAENCFTHGFRDCRPPWHIRVEACAEGDRWSLSVADNGVGITEETVASIYEQVERYRSDVATNYENLRLGGMGLVNTLLRLSLSQEEKIDFSISNNVEKGTVVQIGGRLI
jgi:sensor histidine kinase YesM